MELRRIGKAVVWALGIVALAMWGPVFAVVWLFDLVVRHPLWAAAIIGLLILGGWLRLWS